MARLIRHHVRNCTPVLPYVIGIQRCSANLRHHHQRLVPLRAYRPPEQPQQRREKFSFIPPPRLSRDLAPRHLLGPTINLLPRARFGALSKTLRASRFLPLVLITLRSMARGPRLSQ